MHISKYAESVNLIVLSKVCLQIDSVVAVISNFSNTVAGKTLKVDSLSKIKAFLAISTILTFILPRVAFGVVRSDTF